MLHIPCTSSHVKTGHQNLQCITTLNYFPRVHRRVVSQNLRISLRNITSNIMYISKQLNVGTCTKMLIHDKVVALNVVHNTYFYMIMDQKYLLFFFKITIFKRNRAHILQDLSTIYFSKHAKIALC